MPALQPAQGIARVVFRGSMAGVSTATVMHVQSNPGATTWSQADIQALATGIRALYVTNFIPLLAPAFVLGACECTDLSSNLGLVATAGTTTPGTGALTALPANVALCVSWKTAVHFRGGHCRTYFAGLGTSDVANGNTWVTGRVSAWLNAAIQFRVGISGIATTGAPFMVMLSRYRTDPTTHLQYQLTPPVAYQVIGTSVDDRIDTQRRRVGKDR